MPTWMLWTLAGAAWAAIVLAAGRVMRWSSLRADAVDRRYRAEETALDGSGWWTEDESTPGSPSQLDLR